MAADLRLFLFVVFLLPVTVFGQKIIERHVEVNASRVRLGEALALVAKDGDFKLSYNSAVVNGDSVVSVNANGTVEEALRTLVGSGFQIKETGEHIILLGSRGDRKRSTISGTIYDADSKRPVLHAYLHEVGGSAMVTTDGSGAFELTVSGDHDRTAILVMRKEYHDTVIYVPKGSAFGQVPMRKRDILERVEPICLYERCQVEDLGVTRLLVPRSELDQAQNITIEEERPWQISLIPNVSTNGPIASAVVNKLSLNILGGYARGLNGLEVGGLADILLGDAEIVVAGGMESMSRTPYYLEKARYGYRFGDGALIDGISKDGLMNVYDQQAMGVCADLCATENKISREEQDAFAIESYTRSANAWKAGKFSDEVVPVTVKTRKGDIVVSEDEEFKNVNFDKLKALKGVFTKDGTVTAGNASTINDGAAALVLMSADKAKELGLTPLAKVVGYADAEQAPEWFTTTPAKAVPIAVEKAGLKMSDIQYVELNEAFSVVGIANTKMLNLDPSKVNVNGGAVSLGHPLGCSGARIVVTLLNVLKQNKAKYGAAGICNGGGGASAIVIELL